jgi:hypothetical protein
MSKVSEVELEDWFMRCDIEFLLSLVDGEIDEDLVEIGQNFEKFLDTLYQKLDSKEKIIIFFKALLVRKKMGDDLLKKMLTIVNNLDE